MATQAVEKQQTQHPTDDTGVNLLDLPEPLITHIISFLDTEDKKTTACISQYFLSLIRQYWTTVVYLVSETQQLSTGLAHWPNLRTVIIAANQERLQRYQAGEEGEHEVPFHHQEMPALPRAVRHTLAGLGSILNGACRDDRKLKLVLRLPRSLRAAEILDLLYIPFAKRQNLDDPLYNSLLASGESGIPRLIIEQISIPSSVSSSPPPKPHRPPSGGSKKEKIVLRLPPPRQNNTSLPSTSTVPAAPASVLRSPPYFWSAGNYSEARQPFIGDTIIGQVDVSVFKPDGACRSFITRSGITWCLHTSELLRISAYGNLEALRVWMPPCEAFDMELDIAFQQRVAPQLTSKHLPLLKELQLGRPASAPFSIMISNNTIDLPGLTSLVLGDRVGVNTFEHLTHLTALKFLKITLSDYAEERQQHPQDLSVLSKLTNLSSLTLTNWCVTQPQHIASLKHLTELHIYSFSGSSKFIKLTAAMPNIKGASFTREAFDQRMRYKEKSVFVRWALRTMHTCLPNVQVLQLGPLGLAGLIPVPKTISDLHTLSKAVDCHAAVTLSNSTPHLEYLQLDCVFEMSDYELEVSCGEGMVSLERRFRDFNGRIWDRCVMFVMYEDIEVIVAEFHYYIVENGGGSSKVEQDRGSKKAHDVVEEKEQEESEADESDGGSDDDGDEFEDSDEDYYSDPDW